VAAKKAKESGTVAAKGLIVIAGTDEGMVREKAIESYQRLTGGVDDGFTHETIDGTADNSDAAYAACASVVQSLQTLPMFGGDKVVWLRNANFLGDTVTGRSQRTEAGLEALRAQLERGLPPGVSLLISATGVDKRRAFWKFLEKNAELKVMDRIDTSREGWQEQAAALVLRMAGGQGLRFEDDALDLFVLLAGGDTRQIASELEKIAVSLGPDRHEVTRDLVMDLVPLSREAVIHETGRALQAGDAAQAVRLIDQQLEADESAIGIMRASVIGVVRNLYLAKLVTTRFKVPTGNYNSFVGALNRLPESETSWLPRTKDGSGLNLYPLFLALPQAAHFELEGLQSAMEAAHRADLALVSTGQDHRMVLHRLVVEIASARKNRSRAS
jgi:DNA polymerase-3 subunit delta